MGEKNSCKGRLETATISDMLFLVRHPMSSEYVPSAYALVKTSLSTEQCNWPIMKTRRIFLTLKLNMHPPVNRLSS